MPILSIKSLPQENTEKMKIALKKVTIAISEVYGCKPNQVWATWQEIQPGFYVEGENEANTQPHLTHPPICELTCFEGKDEKTIEKLLEVAAKTLTEVLKTPNNIFITYHEAKSGRVIAGNAIVRTK